MALSTSVYGSDGTPRVFCDLIQWARAINYVEEYKSSGLEEIGNTREGDVWGFNPARTSTFALGTGFNPDSNGTLQVEFKNYDSYHDKNQQFRLLLQTTNYYAILNHNLGLLGADRWIEGKSRSGYTDDIDDFVGHSNCQNQIGYNIFKINKFYNDSHPDGIPLSYFDEIGIRINRGDIAWGAEHLTIGAISMGRDFDLPHSVDLGVAQKFSFDEIKTQRTITGDEITRIEGLKPDWGELSPWTHIDLANYDNASQGFLNEDYRTASFKGRRSWKLRFNFISKEKMFPRTFDGNMGGFYDVDTNEFNVNDETYHYDSIVANWMNFTMNGTLKFLFQPNSTKQDFAICRLSSNIVKIQQTATNLYEFSATIVETW